MFAISIVRTLIGIIPAACLAILLYQYNVFTLGLPLLGFFSLLMMNGWWLALFIIAMLLRHGMGADSLAWLVVFMFAPISAVYYPVAVLPDSIQWMAWIFPMAPVFEGMRAVLNGEGIRWGLIALSFGLNLAYMALAGWFFARAFAYARRTGSLLQQGE